MTAVEQSAVADRGDDEHPVRHVLVRLVPAGVALAAVLCAIGWVVVEVLTPSALTEWERGVSESWSQARTPQLDTITRVGSLLSDTVTCIALLLVMVVVTRWWLGRWREPWTLVAAIVGELLVFLVVTFVVQRDRPEVPRLDAAPPTSSFPSGHTAAAVALYGCIAVIVWRNLRNRPLAAVLVVCCALVPVAVGLSRVYRGMHHPSDVLFGALGGGIWLLVVVATMLPRDRAEAPSAVPPSSEHPVEPVPASRQATSA